MHASEVAYVWDNLAKSHLFPDGASPALAAASPTDQALAKQVSRYWVNFARTGNPNGLACPIGPSSASSARPRRWSLTTRPAPVRG